MRMCLQEIKETIKLYRIEKLHWQSHLLESRDPKIVPPNLDRIMSELRRFRAEDLFRFNPISLDHLTETYNLQFYLSYMATWPDLFLVQHAPAPHTPSSLAAKAKT